VEANISLPRLLLKTLLLFVALNLAFAGTNALPALGRLSAYNRLFPGRPRLPYGDDPTLSYNVTLFNLEAMFAAHRISAAPKPADEYRVVLIGDSAVWGFLLTPQQTLDAYLNAARLTLPDGRTVRAFNLGYPTLSLAKDLLILQRALQYQPDLIIWLTTLESFPHNKQLASPIVQHNPQAIRPLIPAYDLPIAPDDPAFVQPTFWERTLIGRRRALADLLRLQVYGVLWAATGIDQYYPESYPLRATDLEPDSSFYDLADPLTPDDLAFDLLRAGIEMAADVPVLLVNEPMFISDGQNSDIRYNFYYPRWAYDQYRRLLAEQAAQQGWNYLDLWDAVPNDQFTNTAFHLTPAGSALLAEKIGEAILTP